VPTRAYTDEALLHPSCSELLCELSDPGPKLADRTKFFADFLHSRAAVPPAWGGLGRSQETEDALIRN
jgi:hypothetical protein